MSTLNPEAQKIAKQSVEAVQPGSTNTNNVNAALTSVEPGSGRVVAMAQNAEWVNPRMRTTTRRPSSTST